MSELAKIQVIAYWRLMAVGCAFLMIATALSWRFATLQVMPAEAGKKLGQDVLSRRAASQLLRTETLPAHRGLITDRNGEPLAVSTPIVSLFANPSELSQHKDRWPQLAAILQLDPNYLEEKIQQRSGKKFVYLQRRMSPEAAEQVLKLGIEGVYGQHEYQRFYPGGEVTAHLIGFNNVDDQGQEGIELAFDDWLKGEPGKKQVVKDLHGQIIKDVKQLSEAHPGKPLQLSIDLRLQYIVYKELKAAVNHFNADSGSVVLLNVKTGEVLAMANQPSFNPNDRGQLKPNQMRNRAVIDLFEPGSTVKPLTLIAALESGKYQPETEIDTNPGWIRVGRKTLYDHSNYGVVNLTKLIAKSSQVGTSKIALSLEPEKVRDVFYRVGLGQSTGSGFPGEGVGVLPSHSQWKPIEQVTLAFGYGLSVTNLQLAQAYAVLASRGQRRPVTLIKLAKAPEAQQVIEKDVAGKVVEMMKAVIKPGGTATRAAVEGYEVAGKTGTVHKVGTDGYDRSKYISVFAGIAPADNSEVVAVIMIKDPQGKHYYGGEVAAPVFSKIIGKTMQLLGVPATEQPTEDLKVGDGQAQPSNNKKVGLADSV